jgi:hypothetical protein
VGVEVGGKALIVLPRERGRRKTERRSKTARRR